MTETLAQNSPAFIARIPGSGAIAARGTITGYDVGFADRTDDTAIYDFLPDGTGIYRFTIVATDLPADFRIHLRTHHQGATFSNGSRDLILTAADFDANGIATIEDIYPPGTDPRVCHTAIIRDERGTVQASSPVSSPEDNGTALCVEPDPNDNSASGSQLFNIPPMNRVVITTETALRVNDDHDHMDGTVEEE